MSGKFTSLYHWMLQWVVNEIQSQQFTVILFRVTFTPTVEHCSMATVIGLCLRVKLMRSLPPRYKV